MRQISRFCNNRVNVQNRFRVALLLVTIIFLSVPNISEAQISLSAESVALGGGGTAYLTGYESLFVNPANLHIREKNYRLQIALFQGGASFDTAVPFPNPVNRFSHFGDSMLPYTGNGSDRNFTDELAFDEFMSRNLPGNRRFTQQQTKTDFYWFGMKWYGADRSYGLALRSRTLSRHETGRGFYTAQPVETRDDELLIERSFHHNYQTLHELSFGYAESFTFLNGLMPRLSEFIIGIAPKIVVAGSSLESDYTNHYRSADGGQTWNREFGYSERSSGIFNGSDIGISPSEAATLTPSATLTDILSPTGVGFGLDIGLTYLITFGSDLSVLRREDMPTEKSLRFSLSVNDLGAVFYYGEPRSLSSPIMQEESERPSQTTNLYYQGAPGEHIFFLQQMDDSPFELVDQLSEDRFESLLPTSINAGALFQINRVKMMGDFSYQLSRTRFASNYPVGYFGIELRPLSFLPLRAGTRLAPNQSGYYSFGAGIETSRFDISGGIQLRTRTAGPTTEILGASMVGAKFYLN